ncbi:histidine kinase N-terminal 7TM domain-containing protein [Halorussus lipolyticus]|uniref:histidine kinase N-terminal 7TM domain-containing protein n=1 Tax=Halorussus lipolyticus TaxID=3034024 RepID=UPI0023E7CBEF|nr:histidine kinase N-terminal 7TM domain-containing protein [Halorussus sp. DT80]
MNWVTAIPWLSGGSLLAGVATLALASYLYQYRGKPGANWFFAQLVMQAMTCLIYGVSLFVFDPALRLAFTGLLWISFTWLGPLFLAFALEYTGRAGWIRSPLFGLVLSVPALVTVLLVTNQYQGLLWTDFRILPTFGAATVEYAFGPVAYLGIGMGMSTTGIGFLLLLETITSYGPLYRREATAVALSPIPPSIGLTVWLFGLGPIPQANIAMVLFLPHVLLDAYAFVGTNMFESNPTTLRVAERTAIEDLDTPIAVLDKNEQVVDLNDSARRLFDAEKSAALGSTLTTLSGLDSEDLTDGAVVTLPVDNQRREFVLSFSSLTDPRGTRVGETVSFQDITAERQHRQRLEVLNRVLRHNLRNEMTVIQGYARNIAESAEDESLAGWANTIAEAGDRLAGIGEKARDFEQVIDSEFSPATVDVRELVADVRANLEAEFPGATVDISVETDEDARVYTDRDLLGLVLQNLVENALEHNDSSDPCAEVTMRPDSGDAVAVSVRDDGPGIPEEELAPLRSGSEDALEHGSGIGLWITYWGVKRLGGNLSFRTGEDGTTAAVSLPRETDEALLGSPNPNV